MTGGADRLVTRLRLEAPDVDTTVMGKALVTPKHVIVFRLAVRVFTSPGHASRCVFAMTTAHMFARKLRLHRRSLKMAT